MRISECLAQPSLCLPEPTQENIGLAIATFALGYLIAKATTAPTTLQNRITHPPEHDVKPGLRKEIEVLRETIRVEQESLADQQRVAEDTIARLTRKITQLRGERDGLRQSVHVPSLSYTEMNL